MALRARFLKSAHSQYRSQEGDEVAKVIAQPKRRKPRKADVPMETKEEPDDGDTSGRTG